MFQRAGTVFDEFLDHTGYRGNNMIPPAGTGWQCSIDRDEWDTYEIKNLSCLVPVRDNSPMGMGCWTGVQRTAISLR